MAIWINIAGIVIMYHHDEMFDFMRRQIMADTILHSSLTLPLPEVGWKELPALRIHAPSCTTKATRAQAPFQLTMQMETNKLLWNGIPQKVIADDRIKGDKIH
jgi:hypothetical protein